MGGTGRLFERAAECELIEAAVGSAAAGSGSIVMIEGPSGVGKTQLLAVAGDVAASAGFRVLTARCSELASECSFGIVHDLLDPVIEHSEPELRATLLSGAGPLAGGLFERHDYPTPDASYLLLHGLYWLIADLSADRPLLLCIDDLQWCDLPTMRLLLHLAVHNDDLPLVVVLGLRTGEADTSSDLIAELATSRDVAVVRPKPLSKQAAAEFIRTTLSSAATDGFCAACWDATRGNPLQLRELSTAAVELDLSPDDDGIAAVMEIAAHAIGRRLQVQLDKLGHAAQELAQAVAVLNDADLHVAATLAGLELHEADVLRQQLVSMNLLDPGERLSFVHPLVQAAIYGGLSTTQREHSHARAARLLSDGTTDPERAAGHLLAASLPEVAESAELLLDAARTAIGRGAPTAATTYLSRALAAPLTSAQRLQVLLELAPIEAHVNMHDALPHLRELFDRLDAADVATSAQQLALVASNLMRTLVAQGQTKDAILVGDAAVRRIGVKNRDRQLALQATFVHTLSYDPSARDLLAELIEELRPDDGDSGLGRQMLDCIVATYDMFRGQNPGQAAVSVRRALDGGLVTLAGDTEAWFSGSFVLATTELDDVIPYLDKAVLEAQHGGSTLALALGHGARGIAHYWRGELDEAHYDFVSAIPPAEALGPGVTGPTKVFFAYILIDQGRLDEADRLLRSVWNEPDVPPVGVWWWYLYGRGRLLIELGQWEAGVETLRACGQRYAAHGWENPAVIPWRSYAAIGLKELDRSEQAAELITEDLAIARRWGDARTLGQTLRLAAQVNPSKRRELLEESLHVLEGSSARLERARSLAAMGTVLGTDDDRVGARQLLAEALDLATRCGSEQLAIDVLNSMKKLGFRPRRPQLTGPESLTPSERQIAELASRGITNRQIAQDLFISIKTVETHLAAAFRKLSAHGRDQLADRLAADDDFPEASGRAGN